MPQDSKGNFHMNDQRMRASERTEKPSPKASSDQPQDGGEKTHTITEKADGSLHSRMHDGTETDHPDHLHMMAHVGHAVSGGDKHHITHHDGMSHRTHGIHEDGQHEETHDHANLDEVKSGLDQFFNEEGQEHESGEQHEPQIGGGY